MKSPSSRIGLRAWITTAAVVIVSSAIGFLWLPSLQAGAQGGLWDAFCRAAGIFRNSPSGPIADNPDMVPTRVAWTVATLRAARSGDASRGASLAATCAGCHGANGVSPSDAFPNLAGLPADAIYKELEDYRTGKRQNPIMQGMVAALDEQKIADLAAHFAPVSAPSDGVEDDAPALVQVGSPLRAIAPCAACHGPFGHKPAAPALQGQKRDYLKAQLDAFATGARHNDINGQMREVARAMSPAEREAMADWYAGKRRAP